MTELENFALLDFPFSLFVMWCVMFWIKEQ